MPLPQYPVILRQKKQLSQNTLQLDFEFQGGAPTDFSFIAGQFVQLLIPDGDKVHKRSYSIACSMASFQASGCLEIAISFVEGGLASEFFQTAETGLMLNISGPFGVLTLPDQFSGQLVLVGTGTGIAPYRAMLPLIKKLPDQGVPVTVIMGARYRQDLIYQQDFMALQAVNCQICLSREDQRQEHSNEYPGYVQQRFQSLNLNSEQDLVYLCGNPGMIDDAAAVLKELGFPPRQIKREKYVYSGH